ncbi:MAG: hypothetical protein QOD39_3505 [Mycobacterium sp.]|jgi:pimeloyl-ACP methyl ester carboxylesterase|nr:hypothetical protein [Mycobacterium sp.]
MSAPGLDVAAGAAPRPRVVLVDGVPMSGLIAEAEQPRAVIVAFHGGASSAAYFDCPGHPPLSLLRAGPPLGFTVVSLDRPGYGSSAPYPDAMQTPEQRVALAFGTVEKILGSKPRGAGVFLVGHSAGCEMAVRMAADERAVLSDIIGLELAGTGLDYAEAAQDMMKSATTTGRPTGLRELLWEPAHLYPADVLSGMTNSASGALYEVDITRNWPRRDFPALAAKIGVPVQFSVAEHERVWRSDPEILAEVAALFTAAPRFVLNEQADTAHNMSLTVNAGAYHAKVLSFVGQCAATEDGISQNLEAG